MKLNNTCYNNNLERVKLAKSKLDKLQEACLNSNVDDSVI